QIHPGSWRNHSPAVFQRFGRDKGFDIPTRTDYATALKPLLDCVGLERDLTVILFTLDETSYSRELAPLAGVYPALKLGPAWWFHDSPEGMRRPSHPMLANAQPQPEPLPPVSLKGLFADYISAKKLVGKAKETESRWK
ncbi:glucuronate isomerase, partial [Mesorhizobium sp. M4B.F.Ca.ET.214.01.1.1]|uniref:glucuronate isomerase n=1 Tax=Mesorhizobium sp. M4B.F.Ca.ET.214.01.1.1 TaxID=2563955 RepID=UPI001FDFA8F0